MEGIGMRGGVGWGGDWRGERWGELEERGLEGDGEAMRGGPVIEIAKERGGLRRLVRRSFFLLGERPEGGEGGVTERG